MDSSVWISYWKGEVAGSPLESLIDADRVLVNDIILAELLPAIYQKGEKELGRLLSDVARTRLSPDWDGLVRMRLVNLRHGLDKIGLVDLLIAQDALAHGLELYSLDKHFALMAKPHKLRLYQPA